MESPSTHYPSGSQASASDVISHVATVRQICHSISTGANQQLYKNLYSWVEQCGIQCSDSLCPEDVYQNDRFLSLLKEIATLGKCAKVDLKRMERLRSSESKVIGFTGKCLDVKQNGEEILEDARQNAEEVPLLDDRVTHLLKLIDSGENKMQKSEYWLQGLKELIEQYEQVTRSLLRNEFSEGSQEAKLQKSLAEHNKQEEQKMALKKQIEHKIENCKFIQNMDAIMTAWKRCEAFVHVGLTAVKRDYLELLLNDISKMFDKCFGLLQDVDRMTRNKFSSEKVHQMWSRVFKNAWCFLLQPKPSVLSSEKVEFSVRLFGLTQEEVKSKAKVDLFIFPEYDSKNRHSEKYLCTDKHPECSQENAEVIVTYKSVSLDTFTCCKGQRKRGSTYCCEQFYRICLLIKHQNKNLPDLECLSLPFTIRTGSNQLWEGTGVVTCFCYSAEDLYTLPSILPKELSEDQVLTMLQALIMSVEQEERFCPDEILNLKKMLKNLSNNDKILVTKFVKECMPWHGRKCGGKTKVSFFNWFVSALKTYTFLKKEGISRYNGIFLSLNRSLAKLSQVPDGSAHIRISRNEVDGAGSETPTAKIVIHVYTGRKILSQIASVEEVKSDTLCGYLKRLKNDQKEPMVKSILPMNVPLQTLEKSMEKAKGKENGYHTQTVTEKGDIILSQKFEKIDISSDNRVELCEDNNSCGHVPSKLARTDSPDPPDTAMLCEKPERSMAQAAHNSNYVSIEDIQPTIYMSDEVSRYIMKTYCGYPPSCALPDRFMEEDSE